MKSKSEHPSLSLGRIIYFCNILRSVLLIIASYLFFKVFHDNTFVSSLVRIQEERKQKLVTTGIYGFVRHPMYLGAVLMFFGGPLLMGSFYGIALGFILTILVAIRTLGEEKMLMDAFEEYKDYKIKVRYRFIPFIW